MTRGTQGAFQFDKPTDGIVREEDKRPFKDIETLKTFLYAGNATITVKSLRTQTRFTYRVREAPPPTTINSPSKVGWFVAVLTGPENSHDYTYLGHIFRESHDYVHGRKSRIDIGAPSSIAWQWFYGSVVLGDRLHPEKVEVWHEGRCGRCNRKLTVPLSIATGIGPDCAQQLGIEQTIPMTL